MIVDVITTPGGKQVLANLQRKSAAADVMFDELINHMRDALHLTRTEFDIEMELPKWL